MIKRLLTKPLNLKKSFFLLGPRGTGKTHWVKENFPNAAYIDLLKTDSYNRYLANPSQLALSPRQAEGNITIIDEVQRVPELLNEVHRLIESGPNIFILTGSSARKLRRKGTNLLAGRALTFHMHPLTTLELQDQFDLAFALKYGTLPALLTEPDPQEFLSSYVTTYLREEVLQEGLTRNLQAFSRFLESASFSQGSPINMSAIARDCYLSRKIVASYFEILNDLLISIHLPVFNKHAKRRLMMHPKFYFFDVGVYRTIRPTGPLDTTEQIDGAALETLFLQNLRAVNDYLGLKNQIYYWQTSQGQEVDFVVYGPENLFAFEIKRKRRIDNKDLRSLRLFKTDYSIAKCYLFFGGDHIEYHDDITCIPYKMALKNTHRILQNDKSFLHE